MRFTFGMAAALLACAAPAAAQPTHVKTNPDWLKVPSEQDLLGMWPAQALRQQLGGKVVLMCEVDLQGLAEGCSVLSETPPGMGFGAAALSLTPKFLFRPATVDGKPVVSRVTVPVNFNLQGGRGNTHEAMRPRTGSRISNESDAGPTGTGYYLLSRVPWASAPSDQELAAAYPSRAKPDTAFGHVVLDCQLNKAGGLTGCVTTDEEPKGQGFAEAARSLTPLFHVDPTSFGNVDPARLKVNVAVHFLAPSHRSDRRVIDHPDWLSAADSSEDLFPGKAAQAGLTTGRAVLDCIANSAGKMTGCQVISELPAGMGFGGSALKAANDMTINPWTTSGEPADGAHVVFAVRLNKPESTASAKPVGGS